MQLRLIVNGEAQTVEIDPETPLLWVLRDELGLTGTKYGCGIAYCGACTVYVEGRARRACATPVGAVAGKRVVTVEGVSGREAEAVQRAWAMNSVPQCGFCQSGQVMSAVALLSDNADPSDEDIDRAMAGNICRCATYPRIKAAIREAARALRR